MSKGHFFPWQICVYAFRCSCHETNFYNPEVVDVLYIYVQYVSTKEGNQSKQVLFQSDTYIHTYIHITIPITYQSEMKTIHSIPQTIQQKQWQSSKIWKQNSNKSHLS